jgi:hypothetical protein
MPSVAPFHSVKQAHYHNNSTCGPGSEIPAHNRVAGTGGKPLCADCVKASAQGK